MSIFRGTAWPAAIALTIGPGIALAQVGQDPPQAEPAQQTQQAETQEHDQLMDPQQARAEQAGQLVHAEEYRDKQIVNEQGQQIGQVEALTVDVGLGRIAYVIASFTEEAGVQNTDHHYALPWEAFEAGAEDLRLSVEQQQLQQLQGFAEGEEPDFQDQQWAQQTHDQLGLEPYWEQDRQQMQQQQQQLQQPQELDAQQEEQEIQQEQQELQDQQQQQPGQMMGQAQREPRVYRYDAVLEYEVLGQEDEELGQLSDLIIDTREGRIIYGVVSYGGVLGIGDSLAAVPFQALQFDQEQERFTLDATEEELDQVAYDEGDEPNWQDQQWAQQTHQVFGQQPYWQVFGYAPPGEQQPGAQRLQQTLEQAMIQAGVEREQARQEAQRLAQRFQQERPERQELQQQIEEALTQAGVEQEQAQQEAERLAPQIEQQIQQRQPDMQQPQEQTEPELIEQEEDKPAEQDASY